MSKILRPYQRKIVDDILRTLKESDDPILVEASVGSGKSLILSTVLLVMERAGYNSLCLTLNSTLIQQNSDTYKLQGGNCGLYVAGLNTKDTEYLVTFASPNSVCQNIRNKGKISKKPFRLIVIDECHQINFHDPSSMYMRIINHYSMLAQQEQYSFKIIGLSGTCYRNKAESIIGPNQLFKSKLCSISTSWLIDQGFLTKPVFGLTSKAIDFSSLRVNHMGQFNGKELQSVVDKNIRLTGEIMLELQQIKCNGIFIFASTRKHCEECARSLPDGTWAIITGNTKHQDRKNIIEAAREGHIKYLLSVNCLYVGIDIPYFDVCAWLRPTESLIIYTQGIGRVLRLHPGKTHATILDYSGNLERHGDIDDPIINEALQPTDPEDADYCITCYTCSTLNKITTRRCIGQHNGKRCQHYFEFKACHQCGIENDIVSRECRSCGVELIDPNAKLSKIHVQQYECSVEHATYSIMTHQATGTPIINAQYKCHGFPDIFESYFTNTPKAKNIFYAKFIRQHAEKASDYYMRLSDHMAISTMLQDIKIPHTLICKKNEYGRFEILKKMFHVKQ